MKKVILMAAASLAIFATSFAQSATAPAPKAKMTKTTKPAMDAPAAQGTPAATSATGEKGEGHGKGHGEARGQGQGGLNALGLSADQKTKFDAANQSQKAAVQAVQKDASLAADAKTAQIAALKSKYESEVQGILTADQFTKWTAMRAKRGERKAEHKAEHKEDGDHKMGGHKSDGDAPADGTAPKMKAKKKAN